MQPARDLSSPGAIHRVPAPRPGHPRAARPVEPRAQRDQLRDVHRAALQRVRAARVERAPGRDRAQVRRRPGNAGHRHPCPVHRRERIQQPMGVGVAGRPEQCRGRGPLDQAPGVHDRDLVGQLDQQREVVRDEQGREAEVVAEPDQFLEDLPLGDHVQRGGRLVHDHDLRLQRQGHRDHGALPHAAGQLVRVAAEPVTGDADHLQQLHGARSGVPAGSDRAGAPAARRRSGRRC